MNEQAVTNSEKTLGFINPFLYTIGLGSSYDSDFHDITSGCESGGGFCATVGYDLVTGWGSPNGSGLLNALAPAQTPGFSLSASPVSVTVGKGYSASPVVTSTIVDGFDSSITLTATGQPTGVTISFNPDSITGAGTSTMKVTVGPSTALGTYTITVKGTSGSTTETTTVTLTVEKGPGIHILSGQ